MFEDDPIQIQMEILKKSNVAHKCVANQILFTIGWRITLSDQIVTEFKWLMKLICYIT